MPTSLKTCFKCLQLKSLGEFYRHPQMADGHLNKCKDCARKDSRKNNHLDIEKTRRKDRARYQKHKHILNPKRADYQKRHRIEHPLAHKARNALNNAVSRKRITKLPCFVCGELKVHGHHPDYSRPLDVIWLCPVHHSEVHNMF